MKFYSYPSPSSGVNRYYCTFEDDCFLFAPKQEILNDIDFWKQFSGSDETINYLTTESLHPLELIEKFSYSRGLSETMYFLDGTIAIFNNLGEYLLSPDWLLYYNNNYL